MEHINWMIREKNRVFDDETIDSIGYFCGHLYVKNKNKPFEMSNMELRDYDKLMYEMMKKRGYEVEMKFVTHFNDVYYASDAEEDAWCEEQSKFFEVKGIIEEHSVEIENAGEGSYNKAEVDAYESALSDYFDYNEIEQNIVWVNDDSGWNGQKYILENTLHGNESINKCVHVELSLIAHLPKQKSNDNKPNSSKYPLLYCNAMNNYSLWHALDPKLAKFFNVPEDNYISGDDINKYFKRIFKKQTGMDIESHYSYKHKVCIDSTPVKVMPFMRRLFDIDCNIIPIGIVMQLLDTLHHYSKYY
jgi:hypothetical protein